MRIYTLGHKLKLGDTWTLISWLLQQRDVALTEETRASGKGKPVRDCVAEIAALLDTDASIRFVPGNRGRRLIADRYFAHDYLATKERWTRGGSQSVCVQLDGRWHSELKNPSE